MNRKKSQKKLFFSKTLEFLEHYLPDQVLKSRNTVETYRDALTVFRRYVTDIRHLSIRSFGFEDCTHDFLLSYIEFLKQSGNAETIEKCKDIIRKEAAQGWRLVQIISPSSEKRVLTSNSNYAIVFEREN